mmetsp:Transcript_15541/g.16293  ORF Transcript_15541/g.16293 Transcript_15541/m.16293 type:complete len:516 (+) Transcript_15541:28-1575(+)
MQRVDSTSSDLSEVGEQSSKEFIVSKSRFTKLINWFHVFGIYLPLLWIGLICLLVLQLIYTLYSRRFDFAEWLHHEVYTIDLKTLFVLGWQTSAILALVIWYFNRREKPVYLLDFACFEPPDSWKISPEQIIECMRVQNAYTEESLEFMKRLLATSGVGPKTAWPPSMTRCLEGHPHDDTAEAAREESKVVIFDCVRRVLAKTKLAPKDIDILVINCSLFSPTPSLCAMVINEFNMRSDILSYNLSGMGCSAGVISVDLAKNLFNGRRNSLALIVSTENLTQALYKGNDRSFLVQNTLFRCGGAAVILSNRFLDGYRAHFKLLTTVRTHYVSEPSMGCVYQTEDHEKKTGVRLSKDIVKVAGQAMEKNFTAIGPYVLPFSEQFKVVTSLIFKYFMKMIGSKTKVSMYMPDFKRGIDHFCVHAGGRGVIDGVEKNLKLSPQHVEASRYALYTYGNTSSSSIWYEMDYIRNKANLKVGQRVLQVAFGSGFKCNSAVWLCINNKFRGHAANDENSAEK